MVTETDVPATVTQTVLCYSSHWSILGVDRSATAPGDQNLRGTNMADEKGSTVEPEELGEVEETINIQEDLALKSILVGAACTLVGGFIAYYGIRGGGVLGPIIGFVLLLFGLATLVSLVYIRKKGMEYLEIRTRGVVHGHANSGPEEAVPWSEIVPVHVIRETKKYNRWMDMLTFRLSEKNASTPFVMRYLDPTLKEGQQLSAVYARVCREQGVQP